MLPIIPYFTSQEERSGYNFNLHVNWKRRCLKLSIRKCLDSLAIQPSGEDLTFLQTEFWLSGVRTGNPVKLGQGFFFYFKLPGAKIFTPLRLMMGIV